MINLRKILKSIKFFIHRRSSLFYRNFQDEFYNFQQEALRGSTDEIKNRQKIYMPYINAIPKKIFNKYYFLDAGFGRGEFIELLQQEGLKKIVGIDINLESVRKAKEKGQHAIRDDINRYLYLNETLLGGISAFHIIEHMEFPQLFDFLVLSRERLVKGGILIMETPNIENILVSSTSFHYDHTHRLKIPALFLKILLEFIGFSKVELLYLHPNKEKTKSAYEKMLYGPQDLGIIAYK